MQKIQVSSLQKKVETFLNRWKEQLKFSVKIYYTLYTNLTNQSIDSSASRNGKL